jgi:hypothetical protein
MGNMAQLTDDSAGTHLPENGRKRWFLKLLVHRMTPCSSGAALTATPTPSSTLAF